MEVRALSLPPQRQQGEFQISGGLILEKGRQLPKGIKICHMPPEDMISQKVVTIKTVCSIKAFRILGVKLHNFQNTFHQLFWRYGNPEMHFLGTLKIEFLILDV